MSEKAYYYYQRGRKLLLSGNPAQASVLLEKAKKLEPKKGSIRESLGRAYYNYAQYKKAAHEFLQALEIDPTNHFAHYCLSLCFIRKGEKTKAARHIKLASAMKPEEENYQRILSIINSEIK